jgi:hypothetical protein
LVHEALAQLGVADLEHDAATEDDSASLRLLTLCLAICRQGRNGRHPGSPDGNIVARLDEILHEAARSLTSGKPRQHHFATAILHLVERTLRLQRPSRRSSPVEDVNQETSPAGLQISDRRNLDRRPPPTREGPALACGTYSTPDFIADAMVSDVLRQLADAGKTRPRILDLSLEAGHFALAVASRSTVRRPVSFYGLDRDREALAVARRLLAFYLEDRPPRCFELHTSCQDSLTRALPASWPSTFDAVLGNPPWRLLNAGGWESLPERFRSYLPPRSDASLAFLLRAHELLAPGGFLCHVVPSGFLFNRGAARVRKLLLDEYRILSLTLYPQRSFVEIPCLIPVAFLARKKGPEGPDRYPTRIVYPAVSLGGESRPRGVYRARVAHVWRQLPHAAMHPLARADCTFLLRELGKPLAAFGSLYTGAKLGRKCRVRPSRSFRGVHARGIRPFHVCLGELTTYSEDEDRLDRPLIPGFLDRVKVVYQDFRYMTHRERLVAAVAGAGVYPVSTASFFAPEDPDSAHFFAALLNSAFANAWYKLHDTSRSIKIHFLRSLPVAHDPKSWRKIADLGQDCGRQRELFHRQLPSCSLRNEGRVLAARFPEVHARLVTLRRTLDEAIFDLYGLSDRRRKVVRRLSAARVF